MTVFEKTDRFLRNLYETAFYFAVMAVKENFRNYVGRAGTVGAPKPSVLILGNGPSLAEDLPRLIERREHETKDVMAVNFLRWTSVSKRCGPPITCFPTRCSSATALAATGWRSSTACSTKR